MNSIIFSLVLFCTARRIKEMCHDEAREYICKWWRRNGALLGGNKGKLNPVLQNDVRWNETPQHASVIKCGECRVSQAPYRN